MPGRARRHRRLWNPGVVALGLALLAVTALTGWQATRGVEEFGAPPVSAALDPAPGSSGEAAIPIRSGGFTTPTTAPVRLSIPTVRIDAAVRPVGVDPKTGELAVPASVSSVGWYRYGPGMAANAGSLVIAGHVDGADQGVGALFRLSEIRSGARISVQGADGSVRGFRVVSREAFRKSEVPYDRLFDRNGPPRLTLVTCGGSFDRRTGSYRDNVVVTAVPVG
ncbi:MAG TPA: class F sortase [Micromonosporaceae bacterium]